MLIAITRYAVSIGICTARIRTYVEQESQNNPEPGPPVDSGNWVVNEHIHQCSEGQEYNPKQGQEKRIMKCDCDSVSEQPEKEHS